MNFRICASEKCIDMIGTFSKLVLAFTMVLVGCTGLRLTNMTAPLVQDPREDMKFYCEFDMGDEDLYAVKWYKDDHEFFRYIPGGTPSLVEFKVIGVHVDSRRTHCAQTSCTLYLNNLSRPFSSGAYRCEVSSEAPAFRLASQTHNVTVAVLPKEDPHIEGLAGSYLIGDFLNVTCSSGFGNPRPVITWYINQQPVDNKHIRENFQRPGLVQEDGGLKLQKSSSQLRFPLDKQLTNNKETSSVEVACVQTVEELSPSIAPSRFSKKTILVSTEDHLVKNQKLYGFFGNVSFRVKGNILLISVLLACIF